MDDCFTCEKTVPWKVTEDYLQLSHCQGTRSDNLVQEKEASRCSCDENCIMKYKEENSKFALTNDPATYESASEC